MRLHKIVAAWTIGWIALAAIYSFTVLPAGASLQVDCYLETWFPHQVPGPSVEYDGRVTGCNNSHRLTVTVVGYVDGFAFTDNDSTVCIGKSCGDAKTIDKLSGCHRYKTKVWGDVDGIKFAPASSGSWYGCR